MLALAASKPLRSHRASKRIAAKPLRQLFGLDMTASRTAKPLRACCSIGRTFWLHLAPAVSVLVSFGLFWLHMTVGFVLRPPLCLSSVCPLELSLQPQPHFHSLARPPDLSFLGPIWRSFCVLWLFDSPHWSLFRRVWVPLAAHFASSDPLIVRFLVPFGGAI